MNPEFDKWAEEQERKMDAENWWCIPPLGQSSAEFWVHHLFELIEQEALVLARANGHATATSIEIGQAVENIKSRFGIETGRRTG